MPLELDPVETMAEPGRFRDRSDDILIPRTSVGNFAMRILRVNVLEWHYCLVPTEGSKFNFIHFLGTPHKSLYTLAPDRERGL